MTDKHPSPSERRVEREPLDPRHDAGAPAVIDTSPRAVRANALYAPPEALRAIHRYCYGMRVPLDMHTALAAVHICREYRFNELMLGFIKQSGHQSRGLRTGLWRVGRQHAYLGHELTSVLSKGRADEA